MDADCDGLSDFDADLDGYDVGPLPTDDCNDYNAAVYPGAEDTVGDGNDNNCDGVDGFDGDGAASEESGGTDCDDADPDYSVGCWVQVSAGSWHTCAIDNRGVLTCWGSVRWRRNPSGR